MRIVTKEFIVCTAAELKEIDPKKYEREFSAWQEGWCGYDWWEDLLSEIAENAEYYTPSYLSALDADKEEVAKKWAGVVSFTSYRVARTFDIDRRKIELQDLELCIHDFIKLINYQSSEPFALEAVLRNFPRGRRIVERKYPFGRHFVDSNEEIAADFLEETFGVETERNCEHGYIDYTEDVKTLAAGVAKVMAEVEELIARFIYDMGQGVLTALERELEYLTSEELFLEGDHEFEVPADKLHTV
jgi:hypothetical protein